MKSKGGTMKKKMSVVLTIKTTVVGDDPDGVSHAMVKIAGVLKDARLRLNYKAPSYRIKVSTTGLSCSNAEFI